MCFNCTYYMSAETFKRAIPTGEQIKGAKEMAGNSHPVVNALVQHQDQITKFVKDMPGPLYSPAQKSYVGTNGSFLVDIITEVGPFSLGSLDIVTIWGKVVEMFPDVNLRYITTYAIASAYAVHGLTTPKWKEFPKQFFKTEGLPENVSKDKEGLLHVKKKLDEIKGSLDGLHKYVYGDKFNFWEGFSKENLLEIQRNKVGIDQRMSSLPGEPNTLFKNFREGWGFLVGEVDLALELLKPKQKRSK